MKPTRKQQLHDNIREEIKSIAWKQIAESSVSALSLGAIAREMGLTTPALYRYFPSRDDLITALTADAYVSFTEALEIARNSTSPENHAGRFRAMCLAYHAWAVAHPQQYILIFGNSIPGYRLGTAAGQVADRSFLTMLDVLGAADLAGQIRFDNPVDLLPVELKAQLESVQHPDRSYSVRVLYLALITWSFLHGMTSLELCQGYSLILADRTDLFVRSEIERLMHTIGLE